MEFTAPFRGELYLIHTDADNPRHHGLRTNTAAHVLTDRPQTGDRIAAVLNYDGYRSYRHAGGDLWEYVGGSARLDLRATSMEDPFRGIAVEITSHPGRAPSLGEDGLEDAYGHDQAATLFAALLSARDRGEEFGYAPVVATFDTEAIYRSVEVARGADRGANWEEVVAGGLDGAREKAGL